MTVRSLWPYAEWRGAMECNGNGLCFNFDAKSPMCPSMKISLNRIHSPKGRATLVREWLRLLADRGIDPIQLEKELPEKRASLRSLIARTRNSWHARKGEYDFSHEVKEAMSGCLACKACSTQCQLKLMYRSSVRASSSCTTRVICARCAITWWRPLRAMRR